MDYPLHIDTISMQELVQDFWQGVHMYKGVGVILLISSHFFKYPMKMGRIQEFWKGVHMYKGVGVRFADFISFFLNIL